MRSARDLSTDVRRLRLVAAKIAGGELGARSGVDRGDEIGQAARAIDLLATRLAALEEERSDSLAARQAFLTAVGHDLRTPAQCPASCS
ncbi:MAG: HAMP domain-containing protein [Candidatus Limnocylindrales bacterium]